MNIVHRQQSQYEHIIVYETDRLYAEKGHFRVLQFANADVQGALDLNDPTRIVFEYPRAIIHLLEQNVPQLQHLFIIGQGIGTLGRYFADRQVQIAELDIAVAQVSVSYFGCDPASILIGDGRAILAQQPDGTYDGIVLDAFNEAGTPTHLVSWECLHMMSGKLHPQGYLVMNLIGRGLHDIRTQTIYTTLCEVFTQVQCFQLPVEKNSDVRNLIMIAGQQPIRYQLRQLARFTEIQPDRAYVLYDE
ncbi:fused MFS/spermidine synthase [Paenibacillus campi]|uniref:spermidine synthase n=1 Tax=Paenibacillus campi TaxID=3106031 RepID=UPI002AFE2A86|nr:fused MFS/spermidine synthase [Paenibacillus sp. SGZ-1014]